MSKVIFKEVEPEYIATSILFDDDFIKGCEDFNSTIFVLSLNRYRFEPIINESEYYSICEELEDAEKETSPESIAKYLTDKTGKEWAVKEFSGYSQGDVSIVIYCTGCYSEKNIDIYGYAAVGAVSEFCRIEENDFVCGGYFVLDSVKWDIEELKKELCSFEGDTPEEITIELFDGYTQIAKYKTI